MTEVKSTKGIEKNMHEEISNIVRKAYLEGYAKGCEECKDTVNNCSWEKGVMDAWEAIIDITMGIADSIVSIDGEPFDSDKKCLTALAKVLASKDSVHDTRWYVEERNRGLYEEDEVYIPEVGDIVLDPSGNNCVVTNTDTHIHVLYMDNGKTHKWSKDTEFTKATDEIKVIGIGRLEVK